MSAYRIVSKEEAAELSAAGKHVEFAEGCGWIVYDNIALEQFQKRLAEIQNERG